MKSYEHFSRGDVVRVTQGPRTGVTGTVASMTNAGFNGLVYDLVTADGWACGVFADWLTPVTVIEPVVPWFGQDTYRFGVRIEGTWYDS